MLKQPTTDKTRQQQTTADNTDKKDKTQKNDQGANTTTRNTRPRETTTMEYSVEYDRIIDPPQDSGSFPGRGSVVHQVPFFAHPTLPYLCTSRSQTSPPYPTLPLLPPLLHTRAYRKGQFEFCQGRTVQKQIFYAICAVPYSGSIDRVIPSLFFSPFSSLLSLSHSALSLSFSLIFA